MPDVRMRTLLDESLPPQCRDEQVFLPPKREISAPRIFSQKPVLRSLDDLVEVGVGGAVMAAPGADAEEAEPAPARGMANFQEGLPL